MAEPKQRTLVSVEEEQRISRAVIAWLNGWDGLPSAVTRIDFEQLPADRVGMALSVIQGAYIVRRYVTGGYMGEYNFQVIYRIKPAQSNDARLKADEVLNALADWAQTHLPDLGTGIRTVKCEATARGALVAKYENGDEDHQILMKLNYEV